ncbi:MAG TPA: sigma-54 dependent transcriptional regulator [Polyangia bacterium]|nr:sigma-54 dependent transcriptional regulator [Polyangia bacterium]
MTAAARVLVVDDEPNMCRSLAILLREEGRYQVDTAGTGAEALAKLERTDLVLADLSMPGMDGLELLRRIREQSADIQVILMTAYSTVQSAVEAMKSGAFEYLLKPFANEELLAVVESALRLRRLTRENRRLRQQLDEGARFGELLGRSEPMKRLFHVIERAAETDATVLVRGESGTGKELVARAIHFQGHRSDGPFVALNCAALTPTLLESELFGHEKGAFTGAIRTKIGKLEQASSGTLFLDEIGEMPQLLQTKLLRALQERSFERVGGNETVRVDIRVIAATNRDLEKAVSEGAFREDLYYRLNVVAIDVPPLRERLEDVPLLAEYFLVSKAEEMSARRKSLSEPARQALSEYDYPGNVRELENIIERAIVLADDDVIHPQDLPIRRKGPPAPQVSDLLGGSLKNGFALLQSVTKDLERQLLTRALEIYADKPNEEIARILGTSRRVLELRLGEHGLRKRGERR